MKNTIYDINNFREQNKNDFSKILFDDLQKMNSKEKLIFLSKCLTENEINKLLLQHELQYLHLDKKFFTKDEFIKECIKLLNHFLVLVRDLFDDNEWNIYVMENNIYELKTNEIIIENTIHLVHSENKEIRNFMINMTRIMNELSDYKIVYKILPDKIFDICRTIFLITSNSS